MGNQVCCGNTDSDFEHFQQVGHYNRRNRSQHRENEAYYEAGMGGIKAPIRKDKRERAGAVNTNVMSGISPLNSKL